MPIICRGFTPEVDTGTLALIKDFHVPGLSIAIVFPNNVTALQVRAFWVALEERVRNFFRDTYLFSVISLQSPLLEMLIFHSDRTSAA